VQAPLDPQPAPKPARRTERLAHAPSESSGADVTVRALLDAHYGSIWRLLRRYGIAENKVDDAAQEVFWIAARRLGDIKTGSESAFLYGIAIRVAARVHAHREPPRAPAEDLDAVACDKPTAEELLEQRQARDLLDQIVNSMEEKLREVFVLFELEEMEIPTIAEILGIPVGTVGSRLRRARTEFSTIAKRVRAQLEFNGVSR
jgi:RNA polymerase sigma-70 factor (ECF subfamily)